MKTILSAILCSLLLLSLSFTTAASASSGFVMGVGWIDSPPGAVHPHKNMLFYNGSYYEVVDEPSGIDWNSAKSRASAAVLEGCKSAHLVTITSEAEQNALYGFFRSALYNKWYGGYQDPSDEPDPNANWHWVTGEPWGYTNWSEGEPNDGWGIASEQNLVGWPEDGKYWNDADGSWAEGYGYVIEYEHCRSDKATFSFNSKYQKGTKAPTGVTEFQFHAANLQFHSTSYEYLSVTGGNYAMFKGVGTINGKGKYLFTIWAGDRTGPKGADTFRIKIWSKDSVGVQTVIYDNGLDQPISRGSIIVRIK